MPLAESLQKHFSACLGWHCTWRSICWERHGAPRSLLQKIPMSKQSSLHFLITSYSSGFLMLSIYAWKMSVKAGSCIENHKMRCYIILPYNAYIVSCLGLVFEILLWAAGILAPLLLSADMFATHRWDHLWSFHDMLWLFFVHMCASLCTLHWKCLVSGSVLLKYL